MNQAKWDELPTDLQNIVLEEGARHSAINRRLLLERWRTEARENNVNNGMEMIEFDAEMQRIVQDAAIKRVVPNWVDRIGGPDSEIAALFNEKVKPIIGVEIQTSGLVARVEGK